MRIVYDEDYDYYENLMCKLRDFSSLFHFPLMRVLLILTVGTETDPMGSTRPDMGWHSTQGGDRDNYPDDRYPSRYPSSMPGRYPPTSGAPGMYPGEYDRYPTSPLPDRGYPTGGGGGDRYKPTSYPYDRYNPDPYGPPMPGGERDRYPQRMPGMERYPPPPGSVDPYYPMPPDRYPMMPGSDRYYPMDRYPMSPDRYPPPPADRYPPPGDRYPPPGDRYPMAPYPRPGIGDPAIDNKYPPPPNNRYPEEDRYGNRDPYVNKDRYNPDGPPGAPPPMYPDTRAPPSRGQPIDRPGYGEPPPLYSVRYPDGPDPKYPIMHPDPGPSRYPVTDNRFPVGNDRFPVNIYKYGNRRPMGGGYMPMPYPVDMGDRGMYGQRAPRPPYAIMVGYGGPDMDNSISDTYGMPYGEFNEFPVLCNISMRF